MNNYNLILIFSVVSAYHTMLQLSDFHFDPCMNNLKLKYRLC